MVVEVLYCLCMIYPCDSTVRVNDATVDAMRLCLTFEGSIKSSGRNLFNTLRRLLRIVDEGVEGKGARAHTSVDRPGTSP